MNRENKTPEMLIHKIEWLEVAETLDVNIKTLVSWRRSGEENKNDAIDWAINQIINEIKAGDKV